MKQPWVLIVARSPKASDSQSEPFGLAVRRDGLCSVVQLKIKEHPNGCSFEYDRIGDKPYTNLRLVLPVMTSS